MSHELEEKLNPYESSLLHGEKKEKQDSQRPFPYVPIIGAVIGGGTAALGIYMDNYSAVLQGCAMPTLALLFYSHKVKQQKLKKNLVSIEEQIKNVNTHCDNLVQLINEGKEQS